MIKNLSRVYRSTYSRVVSRGTQKLKRFVAALLTVVLSIGWSPLSVASVYAQTLEPTPIIESSPAPTPEVTPEPILTAVVEPAPEVTPEPTVAPLVETTPEVTPAPTPEVTPDPSPAPTVEPTPEITPEPTVIVQLTPSPTPVTTSTDGELAALVVADTSASSIEELDLNAETVISDPSIITDKADYAPTDAVVISGTGFSANASYTIYITATGFSFTDVFTADAAGSFVYAYQLDGVYRPLYYVTVKDAAGATVASTSFTDANVATYDQCSNDDGDGYATGDTGCRWINGNLNINNSVYQESESTVQRLWLDGFVPGSTNTVTFQYGTTKGGKHAYDFLTTWNHSEDWIALADRCQDITGCTTATENSIDIPQDPNVPDSFEPSAPGDRQFVIRGGTFTGVTSPAMVSGSYAADSETQITVTFDVASTGDMCITKGNTTTCGIAIWFGGHVADQDDWGLGQGATSISGSPYHVALTALNGASVGQRDNQMQSDTIIVPQNGNIVVIKQTIPDGDQTSFTFNPSWGNSFQLSDGQQNDSGPILAGNYSVSETVPAGWDLTGSACVSSIGDTETIGSLELDADETITCTFTNTKRAHILIDKVTHPSADPQSFEFDPSWSASNFSLTDTAALHDSGALVPGTYSVSELPVAGWSQTGAVCSDTSLVTAINLSAGETVTCTFTNNKPAAQIDLSPLTMTNEIGDNHVITANVQVQTGNGSWIPAPNGTVVTFGITNSNGATASFVGGNTCVTSGGTCFVTINSPTSGLVVIHASASPVVLGVTVNVATGTGGENSADAQKTYADARIVISGDSTNEVSDDHTFTVTVSKDLGDGNSFVPASGETVSGSISGTGSISGGTCSSATTNGSGQCTIIVSSAVAGVGTVHASTTITIDGVSITRATGDGLSGDSSDTHKTWVDANIVIAETAVNPVGQSHIFTITVTQIPAGTTPAATVSITPDVAPAPDFQSTSCGPAVAFSGNTATCTLTINHNSPQVFTANATAVLTVGGIVLTRSTGDGLSGDGSAATKTYEAGKIIVDKVTYPAQDPQIFAFTTSGTGFTGFNLTDAATPHDSGWLAPGTYSVSETAVAGWEQISAICLEGENQVDPANITLAAGQTVNCTFTNGKLPKLTLIKTVVNDNGGTAVAADWTLTAAGPTALSGSTPVDSGSSFSQGTYALSESGPTGYTASAWVCVGGSQNGSDITVGLGESATCTITNNDIAPILHLRKVVINDNGGVATTADFTLTADGTGANDISGVSPVDSGSTLKADTFALSESAVTGYAASSWVCVGGTQNGSNITLGLNQEATCTITNNDQTAHLRLVKVVTNDNGGTAVATDWTLSATGPTPISGAGGAESDVDAGTYALSETGLTGYTAGNWVCVGGTQDGGDITLALGESAVCTIINDDIQPRLTVTKVVQNNFGGPAVIADFDLFVDATGVSSGVQNGFDAGTYTVSEGALPAGYELVGITGDCAVNGSVTLAAGDVKSCTITNRDIQPKLTLVKIVVNDNGGTRQVSDFPLFVDSTQVTSGVVNLLNAGSYLASETQQSGYTASAWSGDCAADGSVTLSVGDDKTCTITNDDIAPLLTLVKTVINDNGGTKTVSDFPLFISGTPAVSGVAYAQMANLLLSASETQQSGYAASVWGGDCAANGSITLLPGDNKTCTITNDDIAPALHLRKVVINDNGGTATLADFTLTANGTGANDISGVSPVDSGSGLLADTFALSETSVAGYAASSWVCVGGIQNGSNITLGLGQEATCTVTNNDISPRLTIIKDADPNDCQDFVFGGSLGSFTLDDNAGVAGCVDPDRNQSITFDNIAANQALTVTETNPNSYWAFMGASCVVTGTQTPYASSPVTNGMTVNLGLADDVTCTFTNHKVSPTRTIGFWQTHTAFTSGIFSTNFAGGMLIGTVASGHKGLITNLTGTGQSQLFGAFYAPIAKTTTGAKRSQVDQARIQLLQQLVAAKLNCAAFGCSFATQSLIANADAAYATGTKVSILNYSMQLDTFNNSGDTIILATQPGSATPQISKALANLSFWNSP